MKLIIDIPNKDYEKLKDGHIPFSILDVIQNGTPIPDNATNGDVMKAMFGDGKVSEFIGYVRIIARVGNWFNEGVVAEFDKDWWNALYER